MVMSPRLDLRQSQSLVMTPQLQQAIKLLQLSNLDLAAYVEQELERNPLLERDDPPVAPQVIERGEERLDSIDTRVLDVPQGAPDEAPLDQDFNTARDEDGPAPSWEAADDGAGFDAGSTWGSGGAPLGDGEDSLERLLADAPSLRDHIEAQIAVDLSGLQDRLIAQHLLGLLDDAGYLAGSCAEVAEMLGCPEAEVERVLGRLQAMDPPGLFARSLRECLALQLADRNRLDPAMQALLDHLELLAKRDLAGLRAVCGVDAEDLVEMIAEIRALDPKPALRFDSSPVQTVVPDVLMRPDPTGGWLVELNAETLPRVLVNNRYHARLARGGGREVKTFLAENLASANWLAKALDQRANTILKVAVEIVRQQDAFFAHGIRSLKPLILRDIAEAIDMHESTVSRVTSNKTLASPRGIFELKYFFTQAVGAGAGGEAHSAEAVRHRIKTLIDTEAPNAVLSDDRIVEILKGEGIDIARRTIAKYRESLRIPSSVQRRREKMALSF
ncbi:RNA polymerase factor sigma-54 [Pararhodospirillum photometricum]|uniref:RNA polymerase sigma-54 factor n=1 Tax=Pararhodospirillum photometricum DSM 122 TaxID=1150469 RepID=H6SR96_PARPM|nr:RNA polymerase factor sigma-54 [Pararhodospirillum photometricum]CCG09818.1 Sigma-54 (RpoN) [Pararhodospirillum photometricum DSM 122]